MDIEWDEEKDRANRAKHGLPLSAAVRLHWDAGLRGEDLRRDYGERRFRILAPLDGRLHFCAFTLRGRRLRIISLRRANRRETRKYEAFLAETRR